MSKYVPSVRSIKDLRSHNWWTNEVVVSKEIKQNEQLLKLITDINLFNEGPSNGLR